MTRSPAPVRPAVRRSRDREESRAAYAFLAPVILIFTVFLMAPMAFTAFISLTDWNGIRPVAQPGAFDLVGLDNYAALAVEDGLTQETYMRALRNTLQYVIVVVPLQTVIALVLAIVVNQAWLRGRGFFRTVYYLPSITSSVVVSLVFMFLFTRGGIVNDAIAQVVPGYQPIDWLNTSDGLVHLLLTPVGVTADTAGPWASAELGGLTMWEWIAGPSVTLSAIMMLNIWTTTGSLMVIFLAALQTVPRDIYEAAALDGATSRQALRAITLPLLRPTTYLVVTIGLIYTFQVFDQVYVITEGGPARTTITIGYVIYEFAFKNGQMGLASAAAVVLFVIILLITLVQRRIVRGGSLS